MNPLLVDLYELTMAQAWWRRGPQPTATFSLFCRRLPPGRNFLVAAGLDGALAFLEGLRFDTGPLAGRFDPAFLAWLGELRFTGDVRAVPEGTVVFADEPLIEVTAPMVEAQLVETWLMNHVHYQTLVASKAARVVAAAAGRPVYDFGLRRYHGADAGLYAARACWIAGCAGTSNVLAGHAWPEIPVVGTMAHSWVQAVGDELAAFRRFAAEWPETTLLVDTYDTREGVRNVVRLARELGDAFRVRAVRIDSGDLDALSRAARRILDDAGLAGVRVVASGGLDEHAVARLVTGAAPIDAFGVGTAMGTSTDAPALDLVYKLVAVDGRGTIKLSPGKRTLPGAKQVFRAADRDVIVRAGEAGEGRPLLVEVMRGGRRLAGPGLAEARGRCAREVAALPPELRGLAPATWPVEVGPALARDAEACARAVGRRSWGSAG
ncbi:MAG: nicotinate phosphoribosyltransferase [Myxococcota bacterium]